MFRFTRIKRACLVRPGTVFALCLTVAACNSPSQNKQVSAQPDREPVEVMEKFLKAFVASDYATSRSLLAEGATIMIVRKDGGDTYEYAMQSASDWLDSVAASGVKDLDSFTISIRDTAQQRHSHGATVTLKFMAQGSGEGLSCTDKGFDTGNLIRTESGWRILHYSSFEASSYGK